MSRREKFPCGGFAGAEVGHRGFHPDNRSQLLFGLGGVISQYKDLDMIQNASATPGGTFRCFDGGIMDIYPLALE